MNRSEGEGGPARNCVEEAFVVSEGQVTRERRRNKRRDQDEEQNRIAKL